MITGSDGVTTEVVQACGVLEGHGRTCKKEGKEVEAKESKGVSNQGDLNTKKAG